MATKAKQAEIDQLFEGLDEKLDYGEYAQLERRDPRMIGQLQEMVRAGITPRQIAAHVTDRYPHKWVEAQSIFAAARYLERELER